MILGKVSVSDKDSCIFIPGGSGETENAGLGQYKIDIAFIPCVVGFLRECVCVMRRAGTIQ